jgi:hypothetical protein
VIQAPCRSTLLGGHAVGLGALRADEPSVDPAHERAQARELPRRHLLLQRVLLVEVDVQSRMVKIWPNYKQTRVCLTSGERIPSHCVYT